MVESDKRLFNQYGVILVNPAKHPSVRRDLGQQFIDWLISPEGQNAIASYKINGWKILVGIKLSKRTVQAIDEISADEDKSRSDIMRTLIRKAIWKKKSVIKRPYFDGHCEPEKASRATSHLIRWPS